MSATIFGLKKLINNYREKAGSVVVLYHANCVDGYMSQLTIRNMLGDFPSHGPEVPVDENLNQISSIATSGNRYIPIQYEFTDAEWLDLLKKFHGCEVIIVDFSPNINILRLISRVSRSVMVIDHHKTTATKCAEIMTGESLDIIRIRGFSDLSNRDLSLLDEPDEDYMPTSDFENTLILFEPEMCSAKMCWMLCSLYIVPEMFSSMTIPDMMVLRLEVLPLIYHLTDDYDRYILSDDRSKPVQACLHQAMYFEPLGYWYDIITAAGSRMDKILEICVNNGRLLIQAKEKEITTIISRNTKPVVIDGITFMSVNASASLINEIGERVSNKTGDPVMIWEERSGYTKVSLRSSAANGNFDVGAFAEARGGGGHRNAASYKQEGAFNPR